MELFLNLAIKAFQLQIKYKSYLFWLNENFNNYSFLGAKKMKPISPIPVINNRFNVVNTLEEKQLTVDKRTGENDSSLDEGDDEFYDAPEHFSYSDEETSLLLDSRLKIQSPDVSNSSDVSASSNDVKNFAAQNNEEATTGFESSQSSSLRSQQSVATANVTQAGSNEIKSTSQSQVAKKDDDKKSWFSRGMDYFFRAKNLVTNAGNVLASSILNSKEGAQQNNFVTKYDSNFNKIQELQTKLQKETSEAANILNKYLPDFEEKLQLYANQLARADLSPEETAKYNQAYRQEMIIDLARQAKEATSIGLIAYVTSFFSAAYIPALFLGGARVANNIYNTSDTVNEKALEKIIDQTLKKISEYSKNLDSLMLEENIREQSSKHLALVSLEVYENKKQLGILKEAVENRLTQLKENIRPARVAINEDDESGYETDDSDYVVYDHDSDMETEPVLAFGDDFELVPENKNELFWSNLQSVSTSILGKKESEEKAVNQIGDITFLKTFFVSAQTKFVESIQWVKSWVPYKLLGYTEGRITPKQQYLNEKQKLQLIDRSLKQRLDINDHQRFSAFKKFLSKSNGSTITKKLASNQINIGERAIKRLHTMQSNEVSDISVAIKIGNDEVEFASNPVTAKAMSWYLFAEAAERNLITKNSESGELQITSSDPNNKIFNFLTSAMEAQAYQRTEKIDDSIVYKQTVIGMNMEDQNLPCHAKALTFEQQGLGADAKLIITFNAEKVMDTVPILWIDAEQMQASLTNFSGAMADEDSLNQTNNESLERASQYARQLESILPDGTINEYEKRLEILNGRIRIEDEKMMAMQLRLGSLDNWNIRNFHMPEIKPDRPIVSIM